MQRHGPGVTFKRGTVMATRNQTGNSLVRALNVINTALTENQDCWPWSQIVESARKRLDGAPLVIAVEDDRSEDREQEQFVVELRNDRFCMVNGRSMDANVQDAARPAKPDWKVTARYLDDLAWRAGYYVKHPARIGLDWLTSRLGLGGTG